MHPAIERHISSLRDEIDLVRENLRATWAREPQVAQFFHLADGDRDWANNYMAATSLRVPSFDAPKLLAHVERISAHFGPCAQTKPFDDPPSRQFTWRVDGFDLQLNAFLTTESHNAP